MGVSKLKLRGDIIYRTKLPGCRCSHNYNKGGMKYRTISLKTMGVAIVVTKGFFMLNILKAKSVVKLTII